MFASPIILSKKNNKASIKLNFEKEFSELTESLQHVGYEIKYMKMLAT
jgi:hypothetical protein